jgi:hypothetical protein
MVEGGGLGRSIDGKGRAKGRMKEGRAAVEEEGRGVAEQEGKKGTGASVPPALARGAAR